VSRPTTSQADIDARGTHGHRRWPWALSVVALVAIGYGRPAPPIQPTDTAEATVLTDETAGRRGPENPRLTASGVAQATAACAAGDATACLRLARAYEARKRDGDWLLSVGLYMRACDGHSTVACVEVGDVAFRAGIEMRYIASVHPEALLYWECRDDNAAACAVKTAYNKGLPWQTPEQDFSKAERACKQGFPLGCIEIAAAKLSAEGTAENLDAGFAELDALCTQGEVVACATLMRAYEAGVPYYRHVREDDAKRCRYSRKACDLGAAFACKDVEERCQKNGGVDGGPGIPAEVPAVPRAPVGFDGRVAMARARR
jgi:TPR repeat protein